MVSAEYVVGLTDGEGCFYVNVPTSSRYRAGAKVELSFYIKMQEQDRELLEQVKQQLGCGAVYFQKEKRRNHAQCYRYTVGSHRDIINIIIPFFKTYSLHSASKQRNFTLFCEIADLVKNKTHLTKRGVKKIRALKALMNQRTIGFA